jgi:putative spermidine/putrescine transport system permease protein
MQARDRARPGFWPLALVFALFVLFLYGPMLTIVVLSFQGPEGGLTFPLRGCRCTGSPSSPRAWARSTSAPPAPLARPGRGGDAAHGAAVGAGRAGLRKRLRGGHVLFFVTVASLIMPSIIVSLGIGLQFRLLDDGLKALLAGRRRLLEGYGSSLGLTSALGAHLTWTLPFGLLIMFAVFNRFNPAYEEAARDLGATPWQTFRHVVLPLIGPSVVGWACSASR